MRSRRRRSRRRSRRRRRWRRKRRRWRRKRRRSRWKRRRRRRIRGRGGAAVDGIGGRRGMEGGRRAGGWGSGKKGHKQTKLNSNNTLKEEQTNWLGVTSCRCHSNDQSNKKFAQHTRDLKVMSTE